MERVQEKVKNFCKLYNLDCPLEFRLLDLISELGEFIKEVIKSTNYGKEKFKFGEEIRNELGDVFFSLIIIANQLNIDLEEALNLVLKKYEERIKEKGTLSSKR